jgi:hypothetical protein
MKSMMESKETYEINTGEIFIELEYSYRQYDRSFLFYVVWPAYREVIKSKGLFSIFLYDDEGAKDYLNNYRFRYAQEWSSGEKSEGFPFPDYMLTYDGKDVVGFTRFSDDCILTGGDRQYDLFFTLKLLQTDIMKAHAFFEYHLKECYSSDPQTYSTFLKCISYKYHSLLGEGNKLSLQDYVEQLSKATVKDIVPEEGRSVKGNGFTLKRETLIFYYMFKALGVSTSTTSLADMAQLVQGLTGRQMGAKEIKNTEIYKRLANPLRMIQKAAFWKIYALYAISLSNFLFHTLQKK